MIMKIIRDNMFSFVVMSLYSDLVINNKIISMKSASNVSQLFFRSMDYLIEIKIISILHNDNIKVVNSYFDKR